MLDISPVSPLASNPHTGELKNGRAGGTPHGASSVTRHISPAMPPNKSQRHRRPPRIAISTYLEIIFTSATMTFFEGLQSAAVSMVVAGNEGIGEHKCHLIAETDQLGMF